MRINTDGSLFHALATKSHREQIIYTLGVFSPTPGRGRGFFCMGIK